MKVSLLIFIFVAATSGQSVHFVPATHDAVNLVIQLLRQVFPAVQKLLYLVSDLNSNDNGLRAIIQIVDQVIATVMPPPALPIIRQDTWWGEGRRPDDESIRPFRVQFYNEMINDLRTGIRVRRNFTPPIDGVNHKYGLNSKFLTQMLDYWHSSYDFKGREAYLNRYPQFVTNIQGLDIHYLHVKPTVTDKRVLTILLLHGSPLTLFEYNYVIDILLAPRKGVDFEFEIIAPDLPGYGYSQPTSKPGLNGYQVAVIVKNMMKRLGHEKFFVHCGDVGSWVGISLALLYPEDILGLHTNFPVSLMPQTLAKYVLTQLNPRAVIEPEQVGLIYPLRKQFMFWLENSGYLHIHSTRPDTFGIGADATPIGLAAWILPLMMVGSHGRDANFLVYDGNLKRNYNIDDLMDSLTIYWDQRCMTTSARFYLEQIAAPDPVARVLLRIPVKVPVAVIKFRDEIIFQPDIFLRDKFPHLVQSIFWPHGGHFAGFEQPKQLADSIWSAIPKFETFNAEKKRREGR